MGELTIKKDRNGDNLIFDPAIWQLMQRKHPDLKIMAELLGVSDDSNKAEEIFEKNKNRGFIRENETIYEFIINIKSTLFVERHFLEYATSRGTAAYKIGEVEDVECMAGFFMASYVDSYNIWLSEMGQKGFTQHASVSFKLMFETYLDVIKLQEEENKYPLIKLFIKDLIRQAKRSGNNFDNDMEEIIVYFNEYQKYASLLEIKSVTPEKIKKLSIPGDIFE